MYVKMFVSAFAIGVLIAMIAFVVTARRREKARPEEVPYKSLGKAMIALAILFVLIATPLSTDTMVEPRNPSPTEVTYKGYTAYEGFQVAIDYNCMGCHTITGNGAYYAPELVRVARQAGSPEAIRALLVGITGTPSMPFNLTEEEIDKLTAWMLYLGQLNTNNWPPMPASATGGEPVYSFAGSYQENLDRWYEGPTAWLVYWVFTTVMTTLLFFTFLYWNVRGDGA